MSSCSTSYAAIMARMEAKRFQEEFAFAHQHKHMIVHTRLKISGPPAAIEQFHRCMLAIDSDWPFASWDAQTAKPMKLCVCVKCGGRPYATPRFSASDIKLVGRQFGVRIKIRQFSLADKCKGADNCLHYTRQTPAGEASVMVAAGEQLQLT